MARPRQISDEQILSTMRHAVLSHGPNISLDAVASQLGVTAPALLKRFGSRQELMLAALAPPKSDWVEYVEAGPGDGPLEVQLVEIFTRISDFFRRAVPCLAALRESGIPHTLIRPTARPEQSRQALQQWLERARAKGLVSADELDTAAYAMLGALQARAFFTHLLKTEYSQSDQRGYVLELARLFARALVTGTSTPQPATSRLEEAP